MIWNIIKYLIIIILASLLSLLGVYVALVTNTTSILWTAFIQTLFLAPVFVIAFNMNWVLTKIFNYDEFEHIYETKRRDFGFLLVEIIKELQWSYSKSLINYNFQENDKSKLFNSLKINTDEPNSYFHNFISLLPKIKNYHDDPKKYGLTSKSIFIKLDELFAIFEKLINYRYKNIGGNYMHMSNSKDEDDEKRELINTLMVHKIIEICFELSKKLKYSIDTSNKLEPKLIIIPSKRKKTK